MSWRFTGFPSRWRQFQLDDDCWGVTPDGFSAGSWADGRGWVEYLLGKSQVDYADCWDRGGEAIETLRWADPDTGQDGLIVARMI